jgi:hypothetical protein
MEAIRRDLESAVAAATAFDDEAKVAVPLAGEEACIKKESADENGVAAEEPADGGETRSNGGSNAERAGVPSETDAVVPDEVQRPRGDGTSGPVAYGDGEGLTTPPPALGEMEVSTMAPDTCAEVEVSTSSPEVKEEQIPNAVEVKEVSCVANTVSQSAVGFIVSRTQPQRTQTKLLLFILHSFSSFLF